MVRKIAATLFLSAAFVGLPTLTGGCDRRSLTRRPSPIPHRLDQGEGGDRHQEGRRHHRDQDRNQEDPLIAFDPAWSR